MGGTGLDWTRGALPVAASALGARSEWGQMMGTPSWCYARSASGAAGEREGEGEDEKTGVA